MGNYKGLSEHSNLMIRKAKKYVTEKNGEVVFVTHVMNFLLMNNDIRRMFEEETKLGRTEFISRLNMYDMYVYKLNKAIGNKKEVRLSDELVEIISRCVDVRNKDDSDLVTPIDIYEEIMDSIMLEESTLTDLIDYQESKEETINIGGFEIEDLSELNGVAVNLNQLARENKIDPIEARDDILDRVIETLGRRQKANPCIVGEAGVGKTAIIEGLARRIVEGKVPDYLKDYEIYSVDIGAIVGGTRFRGDLEEKMNNIIEEVRGNGKIILFFDEIHMLMGMGKTDEGGPDAANILKPAISRGDIKIIGATTFKEWKKFIETDEAFNRRLQEVKVDEPSVEDAIKMVNKVIPIYNEYHKSKLEDNVVETAVKLSHRYIMNKKLPDKAITLLDETASRVKSIKNTGNIVITSNDVRHTVSRITGIDVSELDSKESNRLNRLGSKIKKSIIGQDDAIESVTKAIRRNSSGISDPNKPIGSFLYVGPTGVGKTELAKQIAKEFNGDINSLIRFDMSEFMEKHSISKLIGSPPGYVGYGDGGQLTEAVKNNPYTVVLFDEIEKAHPDIFNIFLQILDEGCIKDSNGVNIDFRNTVIIMTSNAGYKAEGNKIEIGFNRDVKTSYKDTEEKAVKALESTFRPELLNRIDKVVVFNSLSKKDSSSIVKLMLSDVRNRLKEKNIRIRWTVKSIEHIVEEGFSDKYGARNIKRYIQNNVEDGISDLIIDNKVKSGDTLVVGYNKTRGINITIDSKIKEKAYSK